MDPSISDTGYHQTQQQGSAQLCYSNSPPELTGHTIGAVVEDSTSSDIQNTQFTSDAVMEDTSSDVQYNQSHASQTEMDYTELLENQQNMEYTQLLVAEDSADTAVSAVSDDIWSSNLTAEFIEQCVQTLDAINDSGCLTISDSQLSLLCPGVVSVQEQDSSVALGDLQSHISLENFETEGSGLPWPSIHSTHLLALDAVADSEQTELHSDVTQMDCSPQPAVSLEPSGFPASSQYPPSAPVPLPASDAAWTEGRREGDHPSSVHQSESPGDAPGPPVPSHSGYRGTHGPVRTDMRAVTATETDPRPDWWRSPPPPPPPPSAAARLAEVECELTVSEEPEQEVTPPGSGGPTADLAPYQEHNYDYPLEPRVAGEVRPSADHQYASRPASPGDGAACSATDHRYAYSPPAALTEEDLIRSISDQLGLPQDHGYSQRHGPAPAQHSLPPPPPPPPPPPVQPLTSVTPSHGTGTDGLRLVSEPCPEPCLVTEVCPPDWEPTLDEPAGHCVNPNLVMGLTTGCRPGEGEIGPDGDGGESTTTELLFDGADTVLLDEDLWESGLAVLGEEGSKYVVLDVLQPDSVVLNETRREAESELGEQVEEASVLDGDVQTLAAGGSLDAPVDTELVLSGADTDLSQLLWTVAGSALVSSEPETVPVEPELPDVGLTGTAAAHGVPADQSALSDRVPTPSVDTAIISRPSAASALSADIPSAASAPSVDGSLSVAVSVSAALPHSSPSEPDVSSDQPAAEPAVCAALLPDTPPADVRTPHTSATETGASPQPPSSQSEGADLPATAEDVPPPTEPESPHETNIVIRCPAPSAVPSPPPQPLSPTPSPPLHPSSAVSSPSPSPSPRPATPRSSPPPRPPEPDPAAVVRGWLRRWAADRQPVTRVQLSGALTTLLGPDRRRRLADSDSFLAQWLDRLTAEDGTEKGRQGRLSYPPEFKLLVLRFTDFMPPEQAAAAFCVPFTLVYKWRSKRRQLAELAAAGAGCVRAKGAGKKRRSTETDVEFDRWLERRERASEEPPSYGEVRHMAQQLYSRAGLKPPRLRLSERENSVTSRRRDHTAIRWLLTEFELGRATDRAALAAYGLQPGGRFWASRLLARYPGLRRPLGTWQMPLPGLLVAETERWTGALDPPPPHAVTVMVDVPIATKPGEDTAPDGTAL